MSKRQSQDSRERNKVNSKFSWKKNDVKIKDERKTQKKKREV